MSRYKSGHSRLLILLLFTTALLIQDADQKRKKPKTTGRVMRIASRLTSRRYRDWGEFRETFVDFFNLYTYDLPPLDKPYDCAECPHVYIPVCSNKNITFTNECYMYCANITAWNMTLEKVRMGLCFPFEHPERDESMDM